MAKKIDIGALSQAEQDKIKSIIDDAKTADKKQEAGRATAAVDFYYKIKGEIEDVLLDKLSKTPLGAREDDGWSKSKILKQIAGMPTRKPTTEDGKITAARNIEKGKPKRISKEIRDKRKLEKQLKAEDKSKLARQEKEDQVRQKTQKEGRKVLFDDVRPDKKKPEKKKAVKPKPKSVGAMAVGEDGFTKHQRHEKTRVRSPEQLEQKNMKRRLRREAGKKG